MREVLTIIIGLLILGIILDGVRRMRAHRRDALKMPRKVVENVDGYGGDDLSSSEFPSGGPRVVGYRDSDDLVNVNQNLRETYVASRTTRGAPNRIPEQVSIALDTPVPMLMDSVDEHSGNSERDQDDYEPTLGSLDNLDDEEESRSDDLGEPKQVAPISMREADHGDCEPADEGDRVVDASYASKGTSQCAAKPLKPLTTPPPSSEKPADAPVLKAPDEVHIINVMAKKGQMFAGSELLDALVSEGLRFGDMDIFHRHEQADGRGKILFSVANIVVPGTFELGAMEDFETPGVTMFLSLPIAGDSIAAYNLMADAAQALASQLDGELKDENRSVMTRQTIEHSRQRVIEYERKRRLAKS